MLFHSFLESPEIQTGIFNRMGSGLEYEQQHALIFCKFQSDNYPCVKFIVNGLIYQKNWKCLWEEELMADRKSGQEGELDLKILPEG